MYLIIEENKNCQGDERVFSEIGKPRIVKQLKIETPKGEDVWCDVCGVDESGNFIEAQGVSVNDSSAGSAILIFGGGGGVRFKKADSDGVWSFDDPSQWGEPFKVLDDSIVEFRFLEPQ